MRKIFRKLGIYICWSLEGLVWKDFYKKYKKKEFNTRRQRAKTVNWIFNNADPAGSLVNMASSRLIGLVAIELEKNYGINIYDRSKDSSVKELMDILKNNINISTIINFTFYQFWGISKYPPELHNSYKDMLELLKMIYFEENFLKN